jgi:hypothetical protein
MTSMAQVGQDEATGAGPADLHLMLLTQQIQAMERPASARKPFWPWLLVIAGVVAAASLGVQGYTAYATIARVDASSNIATANPIVMFQDVATNGPRVGGTVEASSRATYTKALEQFLLDGTGVILGLVLALTGLFVRANS